MDLLQRNKDFPTPLEQANKMMSRFLLLGDSFTKKCSKNLQNIFNNTYTLAHVVKFIGHFCLKQKPKF